MLALFPGRRRRVWALLVLGAAVAAATPLLADVYSNGRGAPDGPPGSSVGHAGLACLLASSGAAAVWALITALTAAAAAQGPDTLASWRRSGDLALSSLAVLATLVALSQIGEIGHQVRDQYHAFVRLGPTGGSNSRFFSGSGNRYDYWRIALREFGDEPVRGVGAGNYDVGYFLHRRTLEDVRQPHSLALQTLAELGLVGALLLITVFAATALGLAGLARRGRSDNWSRRLAVASGGTLIAWLLHTDVDWLHLLPGVTGLALASLAVALRPWETAQIRSGSRAGIVSVAAIAVAVALAAVLVARPVWSEHRRIQARDLLATDPAGALSRADNALAYNPDSVPAYYVKAAALARRGDYAGARGALLQALRREPRDFVTWGLLGDLALRRGDRRLAAGYYRRASQLNPRDPGLAGQVRRLSD